MQNHGNVVVILGGQWGDEGKGKLIDILSKEYKIVARAAGGANAGHTIKVKDPETGDTKKFIFHLIPSGMLYDDCTCVIGNGVVLHIATMMEELKTLKDAGIKTEGRLLISNRAHILFEYHKIIDGLQEEMKGKGKVGTTKRGIGPCYTDKIRRNGIRAHELLDFPTFEEKYRANLELFKKMYGDFEYDADSELATLKENLEVIKPMLTDTALYLNKAQAEGKKILIEGANGAMLDIDHGTYPFVTSSNPTVGGVITGTGVGATKLTDVIGIMKAYTTRVGAGPFPTELHDELGEKIREAGGEFGSTTGRPRRCGWYDSVVVRYSVMINGLTELNLTKLDVLSGIPTIKIATAYRLNGVTLEGYPTSIKELENIEVEYIELEGWTEEISNVKTFEELPENARAYVEKIEELSNCPIKSIGVGPARDEMIFR